MHFQRLRLAGFKSFVEPTEFRIEPGLTGIVGPNGCGKSNLLEALRWVMGANSAKAMRAGGMDALEDRQDEPRVHRVEHVRHAVATGEVGDRAGVRRVDVLRDEPVLALGPGRRAGRCDGALGAGEVEVGQDHEVEEVAAGRDPGDGVADTPAADHQDAHEDSVK